MSEEEPRNMDTMNSKLDKTLVEFFETLGELYTEQANLENILKNGFLMMSRARYNMGAKSVGISQYDENNMKASTVILMNEDSDRMFEIVNGNHYSVKNTDDSDVFNGSEGLRQRKTTTTENIENIGPNSSGTITKNNTNSKKSVSNNDPIKWFGVLVPQSLRQSQDYFKQATDTVVSISNLKSKVLRLKDKYRSLKKEKAMMSSKQQ